MVVGWLVGTSKFRLEGGQYQQKHAETFVNIWATGPSSAHRRSSRSRILGFVLRPTLQHCRLRGSNLAFRSEVTFWQVGLCCA